MKIHFTFGYLLLVLGSFFLGGTGLTPASAQTGCGINVTSFIVLPSEATVDGIKYKRVQFVVNNPNPGQADLFYYKLNDEKRDGTEEFFEYGYQSEVVLIPVDVEKITFYDFNLNEACKVDTIPAFKPNVCEFSVTQSIDLTLDCYTKTVSYSVDPSITIDSIAWIYNGGSVPVHDQMSWRHLPPGSYEVYFFDDRGCQAENYFYFCLTSTDAGEDYSQQYCLGEDDTLNLYEDLTDSVDPGGFVNESFDPLDSLEATQLTFDSEGTFVYYYIAPSELEIPDTSQFTIQVRDCSECAYELTAATRHCARPELVEVVIGGGTSEDTSFRVTLPDGSMVTQTFYQPFRINFPSFQDSFTLALQMDTPTGTCDSVIQIGPIGNPEIQFEAMEIVMPGDSVAIEVMAYQGTPPYDLDIWVGDQREYVQLGAGETRPFIFEQNVDTAYMIAMDAEGCVGMDTLVLTPDCLHPEVTIEQGTCGADQGRIVVNKGLLPDGSEISWQDTSVGDLWQREALSPGRYRYKVTYDHCSVEGSALIEDGLRDFPQVFSFDDCPIDGMTQIFIRDSVQVKEWMLGESALPTFRGMFPANQNLVFRVETQDGCSDTFHIRANEPRWLDQIGVTASAEIAATLAVDPGSLDNYGWSFSDSLLCNNCETYRIEGMLPAGTYVFFAEQFPGCRRDTALRIEEPELTFPIPNAIIPGSVRNSRVQIFDPMDQMASILEFQIYDRFGNVLFQKSDFMPDDDASIQWPVDMTEKLPDVIICVARILCREGEEVTVAQDVVILR